MAPMTLILLSALAAAVLAAPLPETNDNLSTPTQYSGYSNKGRVALPEALDWYQADTKAGQSSPQQIGYQCFHGDISKYPTINSWLSWDALWSLNKDAILSNNNGDASIQQYIHSAILQVSSESQIDARLILATVMQESSGKASVLCTGTMPNCGLMQASYNSHSFDPSSPQSSILTMIREGVQGTISGGPTGLGGPGLVQFLANDLSWVQNPAPGNPYAAARAYNSGSATGNLDEAKWGTRSYANDIANRLVGWDGKGDGFGKCS